MLQSLSSRVRSVERSPIRKLFDKIKKTQNVIGLHVGEPNFDTPEHIKNAAKKALVDGFTHYTHSAGLIELRQAIAEKILKENKIKADPESEITVTVGGYAAIFSALQSVIDPLDEVIILEPSWPSYKGFVKLAGGIPIPLQLKPPEFNLNLQMLKEKITAKTKMIIINNPNNPTGEVYTYNQLKSLAKLAEKANLIILADEVYEKIVFDHTKHVSLGSIGKMKENTIIINSFSKSYAMTGWRVGYTIAKEKITKGIRRIHSYTASCVSSIIQKGAIAALTGPQDCIEEMVKAYEERRDLAIENINKITEFSCIKPKGTFYVFPSINRHSVTEKLAEEILEKAKVAVVPGSAFGSSSINNLRISTAVSKENLLEGFKRIANFLN